MSDGHLVIFSDFVEDTMKGAPSMSRLEAVKYVKDLIHKVCTCPECTAKKAREDTEFSQSIYNFCYGVAVQHNTDAIARQGHSRVCSCMPCEEHRQQEHIRTADSDCECDVCETLRRHKQTLQSLCPPSDGIELATCHCADCRSGEE